MSMLNPPVIVGNGRLPCSVTKMLLAAIQSDASLLTAFDLHSKTAIMELVLLARCTPHLGVGGVPCVVPRDNANDLRTGGQREDEPLVAIDGIRQSRCGEHLPSDFLFSLYGRFQKPG